MFSFLEAGFLKMKDNGRETSVSPQILQLVLDINPSAIAKLHGLARHVT